jgi:hypothetical protein
MKTPEEMAEEFAKKKGQPWGCEEHFLAGYKAAQDQLADADKVMPDTCEHILDMEKMVDVNGWISVKDRLPEKEGEYLTFKYEPTIPASCFVAVYDPKSNKWYDMHTDWDWSDVITHWMPLPAAPKEEK